MDGVLEKRGGLPMISTQCMNGRCHYCVGLKCSHVCHAPLELNLFDGMGQARNTDPDTSHAAARFIKAKATTARVRLMYAHQAAPAGLTDEEAAEHAGLSPHSEYATRCSELLRMGFLQDTDTTRESSTGLSRRVLRITTAGNEALARRTD
jgi:hypothetical protein